MRLRLIVANVLAATIAGWLVHFPWRYVFAFVAWSVVHGSLAGGAILLGATGGACWLWFVVARWFLKKPLRFIARPDAVDAPGWLLPAAMVGVGVVTVALNIVSFSVREVPVEPHAVAPERLARLNHSLQKRGGHLSLGGLEFFGGHLYVASNLGLLDVSENELEALQQWQESDSVVEGPWNDLANDSIWIRHSSDGSLARFNGIEWERPPMPRPSDNPDWRPVQMWPVLGLGTARAFWLVGAGRAWQWDAAHASWRAEPQPPAPAWSAVRAVAPLGDSLLYVVREGIEDTPPSPYAVYDRERNWQRIPLKAMDFAEIVATAESVYVRAEDGTLFSLTAGAATAVEIPGKCEAIARTSGGGLLASFKDEGIHALTNDDWQLKAPYPYGPEEGEHWVFLAEDGGAIAYATSSAPQLVGGRPSYSGTTALWVLQGTLNRPGFPGDSNS